MVMEILQGLLLALVLVSVIRRYSNLKKDQRDHR
jgi:hypothetical protein